MFSSRLALLLTLIAVEFGCQKKAAEPAPRYAVVRFENLTGDPKLDWLGRAASDTLAESLNGAMDGAVLGSAALGRVAPSLGNRQPSAPGTSAERASARMAGATRLISGYYEHESSPQSPIRIVAVEESFLTGKTLRTASSPAPQGGDFPLPALRQLAQDFSPRAKPYLTSNAGAMKNYFEAIESPLNATEGDLKASIQSDPNFGPAWVSLVRLARIQHDPAEAQQRLAEARTHKLDPLSLAELDSEAASLGGDESARLAAARKVAALSPGDLVLLRNLAEAETTAGQFSAAASDWKRLTDELPQDPAIWNSLGYARSWAGDYAGALSALQQYQRLRPNEPNPLDSIGDLQYSNKKFNEAASYYQQAYAKDPNFLRGGELYKQAWAKFEAGDKAAAQKLFAQFHTLREKAADPLLPLLTADWSYRTGSPDAAIEGLESARVSAPQAAVQIHNQLAVWDLLAGKRDAAHQEALAAGNPTTLPALIVRFSVEPSASAEEWRARADKAMASPAMAQFRRIALGYALLFDGKREAAVPIWEEIVKSAPATDFFTRAVYARLRKQSGGRPLLPDPTNVNEFAAVLDKL